MLPSVSVSAFSSFIALCSVSSRRRRKSIEMVRGQVRLRLELPIHFRVALRHDGPPPFNPVCWRVVRPPAARRPNLTRIQRLRGHVCLVCPPLECIGKVDALRQAARRLGNGARSLLDDRLRFVFVPVSDESRAKGGSGRLRSFDQRVVHFHLGGRPDVGLAESANAFDATGALEGGGTVALEAKAAQGPYTRERDVGHTIIEAAGDLNSSSIERHAL
mmetsp:Transcript_3275/g.10348  ORF Transcript_3275/g.10348 Transcript_3275/m.10348 type:complete len:218 (-) Transcript_3275:2931-3584(-)